MNVEDEYEDEDEFSGPSKSQLKREASAITGIGRTLIELGANDLARIPLDNELAAAIAQARAIRSHGARKRQTLYVGRLLRQRDLADIQAALDQLQSRGRADAARFKRLENLREQLIDAGDDALPIAIERYPQIDRQHLRRLLRDARRERDLEQAPAAARALFRYLRELDEAQSDPTSTD